MTPKGITARPFLDQHRRDDRVKRPLARRIDLDLRPVTDEFVAHPIGRLGRFGEQMQPVGLGERIVGKGKAFELPQDHQRRQPLSIGRALRHRLRSPAKRRLKLLRNANCATLDRARVGLTGPPRIGQEHWEDTNRRHPSIPPGAERRSVRDRLAARAPIFEIAAAGGLAVLALLAALSPAGADELADARAAMEPLERRIDQLAQAPAAAAPGQPVVAGSFPRSFAIPGTDTSLRIGGIAWANALWYIKGALDGTQLNGAAGLNNQAYWDGPGGAGNLANIPLNNSINHSKSQAFDISPRVSRLLFDTHTPTAWGEVKAYIEFDFVQATNAVQNNQMAVDSGFLPRLRKAWATLGDFEAGQDTGILHDNDARPRVERSGDRGRRAEDCATGQIHPRRTLRQRVRDRRREADPATERPVRAGL